ncbi:BCCT family transporter, partial [Staphylococcus aureus]|uniref:BCCT family transporter n=1 Tax=Staphylococcus aureus TaxID=1280 RepID=UPI00178CDC0E
MKTKLVSLVFWVSLVICTKFVVLVAISSTQFENVMQNIIIFTALLLSRVYLSPVLSIFLVCVFILFLSYANIALGEE